MYHIPAFRPPSSEHLKYHANLFFFFFFYSNLSNNKITDIEEGTFEGASGVNELILTSNRLESVHYSMLKGLNGLRTL